MSTHVLYVVRKIFTNSYNAGLLTNILFSQTWYFDSNYVIYNNCFNKKAYLQKVPT